MTVVQPGANRTEHPTHSLCNIPTLVQTGSFIRHRRRGLVRQDGSGQTTSTDQCALFARDGDVVTDNDEACWVPRVRDGVCFICEAEEKDVSGANEGQQ